MDLHVLVIPYSWPHEIKPVDGVFFRVQVEGLHEIGVKVGVVAPFVLPINFLPSRFSLPFPLGKIFTEKARYPLYRLAAYNLVPHIAIHQRWLYRHLTNRMYRRYVQENGRPDLIHAHVGLWSGWAAAKLAKKQNIPLVITEHSTALKRGNINNVQRNMLLWAYEMTQTLVAVSGDLKDSIARLGFKRKVEILPNAVDFSRFKLRSGQQNRHELLAVALMQPKKRLDVLLDAFALALKEEPTLQLTLAGDGPERSALEARTNQLGIEKNVTFVGLLTPEVLTKVFEVSGMIVSSSDYETFGVTLIEGMACGLPVVATRSGGPEDFVNENNGVLCPKGDPKALAAAILDVYRRYDEFPPEKLREDAKSKFHRTSIAKRLMDIYRITLKAS